MSARCLWNPSSFRASLYIGCNIGMSASVTGGVAVLGATADMCGVTAGATLLRGGATSGGGGMFAGETCGDTRATSVGEGVCSPCFFCALLFDLFFRLALGVASIVKSDVGKCVLISHVGVY